MIALGVVTLSQHPDQHEQLKADASLVPGFVEELCRYHTASAMAIKRTAKVIKAGQGIIPSNKSANRDGDVFDTPDELNIRRKWPAAKGALGYGYGGHRCIAEALSKAELYAMFSNIFDVLPGLRLAAAFDDIDTSPRHKGVGILSLPVTF
ncbi:hypothetical protein HIM_05852 [Hirsutella minnesotensis 3608]|uniref:Cytochrome P450 n=1 Tax=Hirsutella minnesotensis 3608 TaxID=1043627 RepID=A0A0F7ZP20_9HYPO|nr:hypothetical protein HIM_05852 [Hirsutella minnesotensis 3608]